MKENAVRLYFGSELASLYELGWISADLSQVIDFSELLEQGQSDRIEKFFGEESRPFNRYVNLTEKQEHRPEIVDVRSGSIELILGGLSLTASVIMPLISIYVGRHLELQRETVVFELSPEDQTLKRIMDAYAGGEFGRGEEGIQTLMQLLRRRNYSVTVDPGDIYRIEHVVNKYAQRIVRTIKKNK